MPFLRASFHSGGGALLPPPSLVLPPPSSEAAEEGARWTLVEGLEGSSEEEPSPSSSSLSTERESEREKVVEFFVVVFSIDQKGERKREEDV